MSTWWVLLICSGKFLALFLRSPHSFPFFLLPLFRTTIILMLTFMMVLLFLFCFLLFSFMYVCFEGDGSKMKSPQYYLSTQLEFFISPRRLLVFKRLLMLIEFLKNSILFLFHGSSSFIFQSILVIKCIWKIFFPAVFVSSKILGFCFDLCLQ